MDKTMKKRLYIMQFFRFLKLFLRSNKKVLLKIEKVTDLDIKKLETITGKKYKGIIFDFDETLAPNHGEILEENIQFIEKLIQSKLEVAVFSNMQKMLRYRQLEEMGVKIHKTIYLKPDVRGFEECYKMMGLQPSEVLMVGDNLITDGGAVDVGIDFVLVHPVRTLENKFCIKRFLQKISRKIVS